VNYIDFRYLKILRNIKKFSDHFYVLHFTRYMHSPLVRMVTFLDRAREVKVRIETRNFPPAHPYDWGVTSLTTKEINKIKLKSSNFS
jgi:hypothetical protein